MATNFTTDLLITGKVRDPQVFLQVMSGILRLRVLGKIRNIIFSCWGDDLNKYRPIVEQLLQNGVDIVDNGGDLPVRSVGNYWEQIKTLEAGLNRVEDGVFVFKTRTDMMYYGGDETIASIIEQNLGYPCGSLGFRHKIWIPSFVGLHPFFMADQCYLGLAEDLRRFLRFDADIEAQGIDVPLYPGSATHPAAASAEIRFWLQPFLDHFEVLRTYRRVWPHSMNGYPHYPVLQAFNLSSPIYQEFLAVYWTILQKVFRVSEGKFAIINGIDSEGRFIVRANAHSNNSQNFYEDACNLPGYFPISFSTDSGLHKMINSGNDSCHVNIYYPAMERVRRFAWTVERQKATHNYLEQLASLARAPLRSVKGAQA